MEQLTSYPGISLQSVPIYLLLLLLSTLRIGAFLLSSPFFGSRMVPLPVRIVFSFGIGVWVLNNVKLPKWEILVGADLLPIVLQEIFIGLTCGLTLSICFGAVILAGEKIAATSGLAFASQVDPTSGAQSPVISQIFSLFLLVLFFSLNGHLVIFELLFASYKGLPIGSAIEYKNMIEQALTSAGFLFRTAVMIVLPIVSILFFMNIGIGFITKSAPQLNLFSFGFPMTILGTFFALYFSVDALQFVFSELIDEALRIVKAVLGVIDNG
ncbi:MAG: flagellar biosynthetic protein FliR [Paracoccaceae bacterium]